MTLASKVIIKTVRECGNSCHVVLPRSWANKQVKVELLE